MQASAPVKRHPPGRIAFTCISPIDSIMTKSRSHVLLVDDEASIREPLARYLERQGHRVTEAANAKAAREALAGYDIDILLLDIMMPGEDGLSLTRDIAANGGPPVILLTAKTEETDRIVGLEIGADDYVVKPFSPRELVARIKVVLRRGSNGIRAVSTAGAVFHFGDWQLRAAEQQLIDPAGVLVPLSSGEYRLLEALVERPGQVLNRDQLLDLTRGRIAGPFDRAVDNQISRLRRKIEPDPKDPTFIRTIWGGGYRFSVEVRRG
jgi:two-component system, OmpR family, response regulator